MRRVTDVCEGERGFNTRTEPGHSPSGAGHPSSSHGDGLSSISLKLQLLSSFLPLAAIFGCTGAQCGARPGQLLPFPPLLLQGDKGEKGQPGPKVSVLVSLICFFVLMGMPGSYLPVPWVNW